MSLVNPFLFALAVLALLSAVPSCGSGAKREENAVAERPSPPAPSKREYIGLTRRDAALKAWSAGQSYRIISVDGSPTAIEGASVKDRLNFTLRNGVVVKVTEG